MSNAFPIPTEAMLQGLPVTMTAHKFVRVEWILQTLNGGPSGPWSILEMAKLMKGSPVWYGTAFGKKGPWVSKKTPGANDKIMAVSTPTTQAIFANALGLMIDVLNINPDNEQSIKVEAKKRYILAYALKNKFAGVATVEIVDGGIKIIPLSNVASPAAVEGVAVTPPVEEVVTVSPDVVVAEATAINAPKVVDKATAEEIARAAQFAMQREKIVNGLSQSAFNDDELRLIVDEAIARRKASAENVVPIKLVPNPSKVDAIITNAKRQFSEHSGWFIIRNAGTLEVVKEAYQQLKKSGRDVAFEVDPDTKEVWLCGVDTAKFELRGFKNKPEHAQVVGKVKARGGEVKTVVILPIAA